MGAYSSVPLVPLPRRDRYRHRRTWVGSTQRRGRAGEAALVAAVERGATEEVVGLLADDVIHEEFLNRLLTNGATRDKKAVLEADERGKKAMAPQRYEILTVVAAGDHVARELVWTGTLAVPLGTIPAGGQMRAWYAIFLAFLRDKNARVLNYDCFDPW